MVSNDIAKQMEYVPLSGLHWRTVPLLAMLTFSASSTVKNWTM